MGFSEAHSAEPADPDTMHTGSPPAEPEQSRTFSPAGEVLREPGPPREPPAGGTIAEGPGVLLHRHHLLLAPGPLCGERGPAAGAAEERGPVPCGVCRETAQGAPEQSPPEQQRPVPAAGASPLPPATEEEEEDEEEDDSEGSELEGSCEEEDGDGFGGRRGCPGGLEALIAAGINLGELPALGSPVEPPPDPPSPAPHATGIPGIALLSELADLELRRRRCDLALEGERHLGPPRHPLPPGALCFRSPPPHGSVPTVLLARGAPCPGAACSGCSLPWCCLVSVLPGIGAACLQCCLPSVLPTCSVSCLRCCLPQCCLLWVLPSHGVPCPGAPCHGAACPSAVCP